MTVCIKTKSTVFQHDISSFQTVVSAKVEPDTLTIRRKWDNTLAMSGAVLGNKGHKMSLSDNGVIVNDLSERETREISISDATALRLAKIGLHLESFFGSARDIEWAVVGEQIYLLQARPITTINAWTDFELTHELDSGVPADVDLMTFANVGEVLPRPVSPLSITTIVRVLNLSIGIKSFGYVCNYLHIVGMRCAMNYCIVSGISAFALPLLTTISLFALSSCPSRHLCDISARRSRWRIKWQT